MKENDDTGIPEQSMEADDQPNNTEGELDQPEPARASAEQAIAGDTRSWVKKNKALLIALAAIALLLTSSGFALGFYTWDRGTIAPGVEISGVAIGDLTLAQAKEKLDSMVKTVVDKNLSFEVEGTKVEVPLTKLGFGLDYAEALDNAYKVGREGNIAEKALNKRKATQGVKFELVPKWNDTALETALKEGLARFNIPAVEATFKVTPENTMEITKDTVGKFVDLAEVSGLVKAMDMFKPQEIKISLKPDIPKVTAAQLEEQKITGLVSAYATRFDHNQVNRTENLRVAAKALDGTVIKPGDTFSFNGTVGERTNEAGYKEAYVILDGEFVPGLGGGICQVVTTLYNVVLLADLGVVERTNHSLAIAYAPLGRDATVAYPTLDFKFKNDSSGYLLIRSKVAGDTLTFQMYGKVKPGQEVILTTNTETVIPPKEQRIVDRSLPPGAVVVKQAGGPGYVVSTTKTVKVNGKVVKQESLGKSRYQPAARILRVGP